MFTLLMSLVIGINLGLWKRSWNAGMFAYLVAAACLMAYHNVLPE